jgi:peptidoglycan-associated lipoprotein
MLFLFLEKEAFCPDFMSVFSHRWQYYKTTNNTRRPTMKIRSSLSLVIILSLSMLALWGCPKKSEVTATPEAQKETAPTAKEEQKPEAAVTEEAKPEGKDEARERAAAGASGLQPVYFDFDRSFIRDDARPVMKANAEWLKANPKAKIRIEGNCDERGTKEYNQALGQRRASSAKKYLTDLGIAAKRISLISYGKEKPVCSGQNEECWQKNRRDDLVAE